MHRVLPTQLEELHVLIHTAMVVTPVVLSIRGLVISLSGLIRDMETHHSHLDRQHMVLAQVVVGIHILIEDKIVLPF